MRLTFMRASLITLAAFALISSASFARTTVSAQTAAATTAPTLPAVTAVSAPVTMAATLVSAQAAVTLAATTAGTMAATSAGTTYPICDPNATPAATVAPTSTVAPVATTAATAAGTVAPTATVSPQAGYLGVGAKQVLTCGALILDINPGFPADKGGLKVGDVVVAVDGVTITSLDQFRLIVQGHKAGDSITLIVQRAGDQVAVPVTLGTIPNTVTATQAATSGANPTAAG